MVLDVIALNIDITGGVLSVGKYSNHFSDNLQDASSRGVTVLPLCQTPIWWAYVNSKENSCFYLISCLDIEIRLPKSALGTSSDSRR